MKIKSKLLFCILCTSFSVISSILLTGCIYKIPENPNTFFRKLVYEGIERSYWIHIPSKLPENSSPPLVFVIHGGGGTGENMERSLTLGGFSELSDEYNFIVVYPEGIDRHWNDGRKNVSDFVHENEIDDVGFFNSLIENLTLEYNIDTRKIFSTGISNGAMMSYKLAFDLSDKIAAIAPVAGAIPVDIIQENLSIEPVSICVISGNKDPLVPWDGGEVGFPRNPRGIVISVPDSVMYWVNNNNCNISPESEWLPDIDPRDGTKVRMDVYIDGDNQTEVVLYKIDNGGHTWPDGYQYFPKFLIGRTSRDINANAIIWEFFNTHPKL